MKSLLLAALAFAGLAFGACTLPDGNTGIQISDPKLMQLGRLMNGTIDLQIRYTLTGTSTTVQSTKRLTVTAGVVDDCEPPSAVIVATYQVSRPSPLSGVDTSTRYWTVPASGGPYKVKEIETATAATPSMRLTFPQLPTGGAATGTYCLQVVNGVVTGLTACLIGGGSNFDSSPSGSFDTFGGSFDSGH